MQARAGLFVLCTSLSSRAQVTLTRGAFRFAPQFRLAGAFPSFKLQRGFKSAQMSTCAGCSEQDMEDFGQNRKEMFSTPLAGTLERYDGHIFVTLKTVPSEWPSDALGVTTSTGVAVGTLMSNAIKAAMKQLPEGTPKMRVTPCHALPTDAEGDILYFPPRSVEASKRAPRIYNTPTEAAIQTFVDEVVVKGDPTSSAIPSQSLAPKQFFVCCHVQRDKRCGVCGPPLVVDLAKALGDTAQVRACSHVGGHAYAGNVLMYGDEMDWFGYVRQSDVSSFAQASKLGKPDEVNVKLWRGRMGLSKEESEALAAGKDQGGCSLS